MLLRNCLMRKKGTLITIYIRINIFMSRIIPLKVCECHIVSNIPGEIDKLFL